MDNTTEPAPAFTHHACAFCEHDINGRGCALVVPLLIKRAGRQLCIDYAALPAESIPAKRTSLKREWERLARMIELQGMECPY